MTNTPRLSEIAIAGAVAEGTGALTGWSGVGSLKRSEISVLLESAGLPASWAPEAKGAVGYAGRAVASLKSGSYAVRRAKAAKWEKGAEGNPCRAYRARWLVYAAASTDATIGDSAGDVVLTVELRDEEYDLVIEGNAGLAVHVESHYTEHRDQEVFSAGDVTAWLRDTLIGKLGAARFGVGYYIPAESRDLAKTLTGAIAAVWGHAWISPPLPVATSAELREGIARCFADEIAAVEKKLIAERASAAESAEEGTDAEIKPVVATRLLRELTDIDGRAGAYRELCGDEAMSPAISALRRLTEELSAIADSGMVRFSLLDLDVRVEEPVTVRQSPAEKAADAAAELRRQSTRDVLVEITPEPAPMPTEEPNIRFSLLEMD